MDARQFLAEFGHIANAPGGVTRLRELIYQLAVTGRLAPQSPHEGNAEDLLAKVAAARSQRIAEKRFKRTPKLESAPLQAPPIKLPPEWRWSRLLDVGEINPRNEAKAEAQATFVPMAGVSDKHGELAQGDSTAWEKISKGYTHFANGDVLVAKITPCFENGKAAVIRDIPHGIGAGSTEFHVFRTIHKEVLPQYVYLFLRSPLFRAKGEANMTGTAGQKRLPTEYFALSPLPLPPFGEQSRIVAKVDELMALCDKLEAQQLARRALQNKLRLSTLQAVAATSPHELQAAWPRLSDNFGRLFHAPEDVADLRQMILDVAFAGNISEQSEKVTADLVESLHLRKIQLSTERKIKRETPVIDFPGISEMLGNLPHQWAWVRLNDVASVVRGGSPRPAGDPKFYGGNIPFLKVADVTASIGMLVEGYTSTITEAGLNKTREISTRTVLLTNSGATLGIPAICEFRTTFNDGIAAFIELNEAVFDEYLYLFLKSKTKWLQDIASRGQGQPNLNTEIIRSMWFPLAPIAEQQRVVNRVSELMQICESLEMQLRQSSETGARLAIASISSLTGITTAPQEEPMKLPQTELIAPLCLGTPPDVKAQAPLATLLARHNGEMPAKDLWQRFGGEIDAFYAQLKTEVAQGWITEPAAAEIRVVEAG